VVAGAKTVLSISGEEVQLIYPGPNHEVGNILVHFPAQKLTVMTDVVMPGWAPYRGWGNADYPPGMPAAHDAILATDFGTYVGGYGTAFWWTAGIFAGGAVIAGALLRPGPLRPTSAPSPAPTEVTAA
jgi:hypothetical protein